MYFFSAETGGFYSREIHGADIPADVVEITAEQHAELLAGQAAGLVISADTEGRPILIDHPPMTEEQIRVAEIAQDKKYLSDTDYIVLKIFEASALGQDTAPLLEQYAEQLDAREQARIRIRVNEGRA